MLCIEKEEVNNTASDQLINVHELVKEDNNTEFVVDINNIFTLYFGSEPFFQKRELDKKELNKISTQKRDIDYSRQKFNRSKQR